MRTPRVALGYAILIGSGLLVQNPAFSEEYRGTWEQQMACTPDVWRLCSDQIPDANRITACLRQNTPQLSHDCRAVFEFQCERPAAALTCAAASCAAHKGSAAACAASTGTVET